MNAYLENCRWQGNNFPVKRTHNAECCIIIGNVRRIGSQRSFHFSNNNNNQIRQRRFAHAELICKIYRQGFESEGTLFRFLWFRSISLVHKTTEPPRNVSCICVGWVLLQAFSHICLRFFDVVFWYLLKYVWTSSVHRIKNTRTIFFICLFDFAFRLYRKSGIEYTIICAESRRFGIIKNVKRWNEKQKNQSKEIWFKLWRGANVSYLVWVTLSSTRSWAGDMNGKVEPVKCKYRRICRMINVQKITDKFRRMVLFVFFFLVDIVFDATCRERIQRIGLIGDYYLKYEEWRIFGRNSQQPKLFIKFVWMRFVEKHHRANEKK